MSMIQEDVSKLKICSMQMLKYENPQSERDREHTCNFVKKLFASASLPDKSKGLAPRISDLR